MTNTYVHTIRTVEGFREETIPLSTRLILEGAEELGVLWRSIPGTHIIELKYAGITKYFRYQISADTTDIGFSSCLDKNTTAALLSSAGISVANGYKIEQNDSMEYRNKVFSTLRKPIVVKPTHGLRGNAITMNVDSEEIYFPALEKALAFTHEEGAGALVEEQFSGKEYRVLATREKVVGVIHRVPANVIGDGIHTVEQLVDQKNADPRRGKTLDFALFIIEKNQDMEQNLARQNMQLASVPSQNQKVFLRSVSNIMQGGDSIDMTDLVHPSVKKIAVQAVRAIPGLAFAGVDFMSTDITAEQHAHSYIIVEINSSPGISIHEFPYEGQRRFTDREFLYVMFPTLVPKN